MSDKGMLERLHKSIGAMLGTSKPEPKQVVKAVNHEEQKCVEVVYKPDVKDVHGEWMSAETIRKGEESFRNNEVVPNLFHLLETDKFEVTKSWIVDEDVDFEVEGETKTIVKGTWLAETHYTDPVLWEMKKSKELGGLSLGGLGDVNKETGEITNLCFSKEEYLKLKQEVS